MDDVLQNFAFWFYLLLFMDRVSWEYTLCKRIDEANFVIMVSFACVFIADNKCVEKKVK